MALKQSIYGIAVMMVLVNVINARVVVQDKSRVLTEQLIKEASKFGFKPDQSQIQTVYSTEKGSDDVVVGVPLSKTVDTTSEQIANGEAYVGIQCMATKQLNGCFKVRLAGVDANGPKLELVNEDGKVLASKTVQSANPLVKRAEAAVASNDLVAARPARPDYVWCVWINGVFQGCYDVVIIVFSDITAIFYK